MNTQEMERLEEAIINSKSPTLIHQRFDRSMAKYISRPKISFEKNRNEKIRKRMDKPVSPFTNDEIRHLGILNKCLVDLQHDVMSQVRTITLNLQEQIANGFHQYDSFVVEGRIYIEDMEADVDSFLNILARQARYSVIMTNYRISSHVIDEIIAMENHWYANWSGIFHQLEESHGIKVCRAFRFIFEEAQAFTIEDIMKIQPEMFFTHVEINI